MTIEVTDLNFDGMISDGVSLVAFKAPWCGPCKTMSPILDEISIEYPNVKIGKMDVDENDMTPREVGIRSIPTLILYKNGEMIERKVGIISKEDLRSLIDSQL